MEPPQQFLDIVVVIMASMIHLTACRNREDSFDNVLKFVFEEWSWLIVDGR